MLQKNLEDLGVSKVQTVLTNNTVTGWNVYDSESIEDVDYPLFAVVMQPSAENLYKENLIGLYRTQLAIVSQADKTTTTKTDFETISDMVFDDFIKNKIPSNTKLKIHGFYEVAPAMVESFNDGWTKTKTFEVIIQRLQ